MAMAMATAMGMAMATATAPKTRRPFSRRTSKPLVSGEVVSTCSQCHAGATAAGNAIRGTACESMACLVANGDVDFDTIEDSPLLQQILRAEPQGIVTQEMIDREYQGFYDWIAWSADCQDDQCANVTCGSNQPPSGEPKAHLGGCDEADLIASFDINVMVHKQRCANCHGTNSGEPPNGVKIGHWWDQGTDPLASARTMYNMIAYNVINTTTPATSTLVTKPLVAPLGGVVHQGGDKIETFEDPTYVGFMNWTNQYATCIGN